MGRKKKALKFLAMGITEGQALWSVLALMSGVFENSGPDHVLRSPNECSQQPGGSCQRQVAGWDT